MKDSSGYETSGADATSLGFLERGIAELRCYVGDPVASAEQAIAASPGCVMAHVLHAWLHLLATEAPAVAVARNDHARAIRLPANERERGHLHAIGLLAEGRWHAAARALEDVSIAWPRDAIALQVGHQLDFFIGDARMLRDRIARALPHWSPSMAGWHGLLGMHAFGLEETGDYAAAEARGRAAVGIERRDGWAQHAVAHVLEMQGRRREGIAWMRGNEDGWATDSFLAVHNWWHLAVFHLGLDEADEALALYDSRVGGPGSTVAIDMVDASSLLWRLELAGIDVGQRWQALADRWAPHAGSGNYAFNDMHAMMAFVSAGRRNEIEQVLAAQAEAMLADNDNAMFTRDVGAAATRAIHAMAGGDPAQAVDLWRDVRNRAHRFGGSHAQRDLIDLSLIAAASRAGQDRLAQALCAERLAARPEPHVAWLAAIAAGRRAEPLAA
ncbi:MAG: tetratricopeptide repeat protein [Burkholderiaceae bacterium]